MSPFCKGGHFLCPKNSSIRCGVKREVGAMMSRPPRLTQPLSKVKPLVACLVYLLGKPSIVLELLLCLNLTGRLLFGCTEFLVPEIESYLRA